MSLLTKKEIIMNLIKLDRTPSVFNTIDHIFDNFLSGFNDVYRYSPKYNIIEHGNDYILLYEVPGLKKEEIKVEIKNNMLYVSGKNANSESKNTDSYYADFNDICFSNEFRLPEHVKSDKISAKLENGILEIIIPKKVNVSEKTKTIKVN